MTETYPICNLFQHPGGGHDQRERISMTGPGIQFWSGKKY